MGLYVLTSIHLNTVEGNRVCKIVNIDEDPIKKRRRGVKDTGTPPDLSCELKGPLSNCHLDWSNDEYRKTGKFCIYKSKEKSHKGFEKLPFEHTFYKVKKNVAMSDFIDENKLVQSSSKYIYVAQSEAWHTMGGEPVYKIGKTTRLNGRLGGLKAQGAPPDVTYKFLFQLSDNKTDCEYNSPDLTCADNYMKKNFERFNVSPYNKGEFYTFKSVEELKKSFEELPFKGTLYNDNLEIIFNKVKFEYPTLVKPSAVYNEWCVNKLKGYLNEAGIPYDDCIEKRELVEKLISSRSPFNCHHDYEATFRSIYT